MRIRRTKPRRPTGSLLKLPLRLVRRSLPLPCRSLTRALIPALILSLFVAGTLPAPPSPIGRWLQPAAAYAQSQPKFPKPTGYVNDLAGVLDSDQKEQLEEILQMIDQKLQVQVVIAAVPNLEGREVNDYANLLFRAWGIGNRKTNRGLLLVDAVAERKVWVEVGYGMEGILPDGKVGAILDQSVVPYIREGQREEAYLSAVNALMGPVLEEAGQSPDSLAAILAQGGFQQRAQQRPVHRRPRTLLPIIIFIFIIMNLFRGRRRGAWWLAAMPWGGFGGFGGFGGGGGGFGGFGGGSSGDGGAGRGY